MQKQVVDLKPGDTVTINGVTTVVKTLQYQKDNVRIRIIGPGLNVVRGQFEKVTTK